MAKQPSNQNISDSSARFLVLILSAFLFSLIVFLFWISQIFDLSPPELISQFKNSLYAPNMNQFVIGEIGGKNVLKLFYGFLLLAMFIAAVSFTLFIHSSQKSQNVSLPDAITITGIVGLLLFSGVQQVHRFDSFKREQNMLGGKTVDKKNQVLFGGKYQFSRATQDALSGYHQGTLVTDFNLRKSPYMFYHRALSYHFYPKISLRFDNGSPKDTILLFYKKDPLQHIPENYKILLMSENRNYVLAIKKQGL